MIVFTYVLWYMWTEVKKKKSSKFTQQLSIHMEYYKIYVLVPEKAGDG